MITGFLLFECLSEKDIIDIFKDFSGCKIACKLSYPKDWYGSLYIYGEMPKGSEYESMVDDELWEGDTNFEELKKKFESK